MGCASQEERSSQQQAAVASAESSASDPAALTDNTVSSSLFNPGPLARNESSLTGSESCEDPIENFTWYSGEGHSIAHERQIITMNGYLGQDSLRLELSWSFQGQAHEWSGLETKESLQNWMDWIEQPLFEAGVSMTGELKSKLTVTHKGGCQRVGLPPNTEAWTRLNDWVLSQMKERPAAAASESSTASDAMDSSKVRGQVVFALEQAEDIKSVQLVCENQWKERTGVRNGRARFESVPTVECQVGWIGERKGWFKIPPEWTLIQCIFESESVNCTPL